jgi:hypothetical protein
MRIYERVPDAVQRERAQSQTLILSFPTRAREWCTADPGPRQTNTVAVPGLQRNAALGVRHILLQWPRCAAPGTHIRGRCDA